MHFNLFADSVHLSCWLQTRVKYVASAWTIQLLINAVAAHPACFCPALSRGSACSSPCNLLMNVERVHCRLFADPTNPFWPIAPWNIIATMIFERIKKDRFIWSNVSFSWMKKKDGNWDERISKFDFENCVIFFWKATMIIITFIEIILSSWFISILKILNKFRRIIIVTVWLDYYKLLLNVYVILTIDNNLSKFYEFVYTWWNIFEKISKNNLFHFLFLQFSNESCWSRRWFFWNQ